MGCGIYWQQVHELERAIDIMERYGVLSTDPGYQSVQRQRAAIIAQIGYKFPRTVTKLAEVSGLSPGIIKLWHDIESGWMSEARVKPGAPPVYKHASDEVAMAILKGELTHELETELMKPDEYLGE